jgi:DNA-binding transcriptional regulator YdaS (Cro superfamily)
MLLNTWLSEARGRGAALARRLKVPPSMVTKMARGEKQVPLDHCPFIQSFTEGAVTCEELRPDAAEYFALIRTQAQAKDVALVQPDLRLPPGVTKDRRDPTRPSPYAGTDIDRRATAGEG